MQGSLRLYGGFARLREKLAAGLTEMQLDFSLGVARTVRAALWRSRGEGKRLKALPVEVTGLDVEFLRSIGVTTVGALLALPRDGLAQRCDAQAIEALDRALGAAPEPREFFAPPPRFNAQLELPAEVTHAEGLYFGARRLLVQLEGLLAARHEGVHAFRLVLLHESGSTCVEVNLASATRDAERLGQVLRERLSRTVLTQPVQAIVLEAGDFASLAGSSAGMFGDPAFEAEDWARLVERLRARLGHEAVYALAAQAEHRPEHAWRRVEPGEWDPREAQAPGPRPVWLLEPRRIPEGQFSALVGPERIESGWWDGDDAKRDYFVARLPDASIAWVYREDGEWYVHGLFA